MLYDLIADAEVEEEKRQEETMRIIERTKDLPHDEQMLYMEGYADALEYVHLAKKLYP